jgi:hypothetical protein
MSDTIARTGPVTMGLSHLAVSVPPGTLTAAWREALFGFYGETFGWTEIENSPRPDRLTVATGGSCYVNIRERAESMVCTGYEHFGMVVESTQRVEELWGELQPRRDDIALEDIVRNDDGTRSFRFRYLLPLAMEIQWFPPGAADESPRRWGRSKSAS